MRAQKRRCNAAASFGTNSFTELVQPQVSKVATNIFTHITFLFPTDLQCTHTDDREPSAAVEEGSTLKDVVEKLNRFIVYVVY